MDYILHLIIILNIYTIHSLAGNYITNIAGQLSLAHGAMYGMGAYLTVLFVMFFGLPLIPTILLVMICTGLFSLIIAIPTLKLKGDYFVLGTLGFQLIVFTILYNWTDVTKGPYGIAGIPSPKLFGIVKISRLIGYVILSTLLALLTIFVFREQMKEDNPLKRQLNKIKGDAALAATSQQNISRLKIYAFVLASMFMGLGGVIYSTYISYIDPTSFTLDESIFILTAVLVGSVFDYNKVSAPIFGAFFIVLLPEVLRFVGLPNSIAANMRQIIYGLAMIGVSYVWLSDKKKANGNNITV